MQTRKTLIKAVILGLLVDRGSSFILGTLAFVPIQIQLLRASGHQTIDPARIKTYLLEHWLLHGLVFGLGCIGTFFGALAAGCLTGDRWKCAASWFALISAAQSIVWMALDPAKSLLWGLAGLVVLFPLSFAGSRMGGRLRCRLDRQ